MVDSQVFTSIHKTMAVGQIKLSSSKILMLTTILLKLALVDCGSPPNPQTSGRLRSASPTLRGDVELEQTDSPQRQAKSLDTSALVSIYKDFTRWRSYCATKLHLSII